MKHSILSTLVVLMTVLAAPAGATVYGSTTIRIQVPRAPTTVGRRSMRRQPLYISRSTQSIVILTDGKDPVRANINPAGEIQATVHAALGTHVFSVTAYDRRDGSGNSLSSGTSSPANVVAPPGVTVVSITLFGIVGKIPLTLTHPQVTIGSPAQSALLLPLLDADGNAITQISEEHLPSALQLTSSDPHDVALMPSVVFGPSNVLSSAIAYDGASVPKVVISGNGGGLAPQNIGPATLTAIAPPRTGNQLIVVPGEFNAANAYDASGSHQFLGTLIPAVKLPSLINDVFYVAVDAKTHRAFMNESPDESNVVTIESFSTDHHYQPLNSFQLASNEYTRGLAVDPIGRQLFVDDETSTSGQIDVFNLDSNGVRTGTIPNAGGGPLAVDTSKHLLYVDNGQLQSYSTISPFRLVRSGYRNTGPSPLAVDPSAGKIYTIIGGDYVGGMVNPYFIEVYDASNLSQPIAQIATPTNFGAVALRVDPVAHVLYVGGDLNGVGAFATYSTAPGYKFLTTFQSETGLYDFEIAPHAL